MAAHLAVTKDSGDLLFDTSYITYGLVKSGNLTLIEKWGRQYLKSAQLDPSNGANYSVGTDIDPVYGFSIENAASPIAFIVGAGTLNGTSVSGSTMTFLYMNADANTKFYCFDLMANNLAGAPYLKTYLSDGTATFNSLQSPLNIIGQYTAPAPPAANDQFGRKLLTYVGGYTIRRSYEVGTTSHAAIDCIVDIPISSGIEYAAFLPWSRSATIYDAYAYSSGSPPQVYGVSEGAYGYTGGIRFMFSAAGGTTMANPNTTMSVPCSYLNIPVDRYPAALVIQTAGLPFPFN